MLQLPLLVMWSVSLQVRGKLHYACVQSAIFHDGEDGHWL